MSELRSHLRSRVRTLTADIRRGLGMRSERAWTNDSELRDVVSYERSYAHLPEHVESPEWASSPRRRFHHGIRKRIEKLRVARRRLSTFLALEEKARAAL